MMKKLSAFPAAAVAAALVALSPGAHALRQAGKSPAAPAPSVHEINAELVQLSPIVVNGRHLPFPVALQMVKKALKRSWSSSPDDKDLLVCRFHHMIASHLQTMFCETNGQYFNRYRQTQAAVQQGASESYQGDGGNVGGLELALERGYLEEDVGSFMNQHPMNRGQILTILKNLPPADSSYTLRVVDHGNPVMEYVIRKGKIVKVRKLH